jgi:uncharacterized SAM-dependent methyltransferase
MSIAILSKQVIKKPCANNQFYADVIAGLKSTPKHLSSKYFYDANGDKLFQKLMGWIYLPGRLLIYARP